MARFLITKTLLDSFGYLFSCSEGQEENAREEFLKTLRREPLEPTEAITNGLHFEDGVYSLAAGSSPDPADGWNPKWWRGAMAIAEIIGNAPVQVKASRRLAVGEEDLLVYGIIDALREGIIYDVKFKNKSFGSLELAGSYLDSSQHPAYLYLIPEAREFRYLVSDGEDLYIETYRRDEIRPIDAFVADFMNFLKTDEGLMALYRENWRAT